MTKTAGLVDWSSPRSRIRSSGQIELYTVIAVREGSDPLSHDWVTRLREEQSFLEINERDHTGGGPGEGSSLEHRFV